MGAKDTVAECAQALRGSSFEYEQLLGTSVERTWHGVAKAVERSLLARRGISISGLGKFGFYKELPHALVFLLVGRFLQSHSGVSWKNKPPPAPLAVTSDLNMAVLGSEVGLTRDQTQQSLDELLRFIGRKLLTGSASGRLAVGSVGSFTFEGRAISFAFDAGFVKRVSQLHDRKDPLAAEGSPGSVRRLQKQKSGGGFTSSSSNKALQRSASVDGRLVAAANETVRQGVASIALSGGVHARSAMELGLCALSRKGAEADHRRSDAMEPTASCDAKASKKATKKKRHHHKHYHDRSTARPSSAKRDTDTTSRGNSDPVPRILPRFLIPEPSMPVKPSHTRINHDMVMQAAFECEKARLTEAKQENDRYRHDLESRQRATQLETLQQRAEKIVGQRSLNAFLNSQLADKHERQRRTNMSIESVVDSDSVSILPRDRALSDDAKREQKQKLNKRLNDQVAAKAALKRDRRVVDQAEMAFFISQLDAQALKETEEKLARKQASKQELLADWSQQLQLRALQKELLHSR